METILAIVSKHYFILLHMPSLFAMQDDFKNWTDPYLMVLNLPAHHSEGVVACVVIYVNAAEPGWATSWHPLLIGIIINHHSSSCLTDTLFAVIKKKKKQA